MASGSTDVQQREAAVSEPVPGQTPDSSQEIVPRASAILTISKRDRVRPPAPFSDRQLARLDEAITMASWETGLYFTVYVGALHVPTRGHAEQLHAELGQVAPRAVLLAVSPAQRVVEVVTGAESMIRLPDRSCALAVLSMTASFGAGDLTGGITGGLRMLSDQAGRPGDVR